MCLSTRALCQKISWRRISRQIVFQRIYDFGHLEVCWKSIIGKRLFVLSEPSVRPAFICICQKCKMYLSKLAAQKSSLESVCLCYRSWRRRTREPCVLPSQQLLRRCDTTHTFTNLFFICLNFKMYLSKWQNTFVVKIIDKSNSCVVVTSLQLGFDPHSSSPLSSSSQSVCLSSETKKKCRKNWRRKKHCWQLWVYMYWTNICSTQKYFYEFVNFKCVNVISGETCEELEWSIFANIEHLSWQCPVRPSCIFRGCPASLC